MAYYYGWSNEYIESMDIQEYHNYYLATRVLERQSHLNNISACLSSMQKSEVVKKKMEKLSREIKDSFETEISAVNAKYLAEEMLKNGN